MRCPMKYSARHAKKRMSWGTGGRPVLQQKYYADQDCPERKQENTEYKIVPMLHGSVDLSPDRTGPIPWI
jgi:hypothetical protein